VEEEFGKEISQLYEEGRYGQLIKRVYEKHSNILTCPTEIFVKFVCAQYWQGNYKLAKDFIKLANNGYKDVTLTMLQLDILISGNAKAVQEVEVAINDTSYPVPELWNALAIATIKEPTLDRLVRIDQAMKGLKNSPELAAINLQNNVARVFSMFGFSEEANNRWQQALERYGNKNYHHRANICSRLAVDYDLQREYCLAKSKAKEACDLWKKALENDPGNLEFIRNLIDAETMLRELIEITAKKCRE